jgi:hypothetical protein
METPVCIFCGEALVAGHAPETCLRQWNRVVAEVVEQRRVRTETRARMLAHEA